MSTITYEGLEYNILYIDPSIETAGDGTTPTGALANLPTAWTDKTCYLIRRTTEEYNTSMTKTGSTGMTYIMIMGMPTSTDTVYASLPEEVKTAWGADTAVYANVLMDQDSYSETETNCVFYQASLCKFVSYNCYYKRSSNGAGINHSDTYTYGFFNYMFYFTNSCSFEFNGCKFGYTQYDIDNEDFRNNNSDISTDTSKYPQHKCGAFIYAPSVYTASFKNCIFNWIVSYYAARYNEGTGNRRACDLNAIYTGGAQYLLVEDCTINKLNRENYYSTGDVNRCNGWHNWTGQGYSKYHNVTINQIYMNGNRNNNNVIYDARYNIDMENIQIHMLNMKGFELSNVSLSNTSWYAIIYLASVHDSIKLKNIKVYGKENEHVLFSGLPIIFLNHSVSLNSQPNNYISDINIEFSKNPAKITSDTILQFNGETALYQYGSDSYGSEYMTNYRFNPNGCNYLVKDITVDAEKNTGYALQLFQSKAKVKELNGRVYIDNSILDVDKIYSYYGTSTAIYAYYNSFVRCGELDVNQDSYKGGVAIDMHRDQQTSVYIGKSNAKLAYETYGTNVWNKNNNSELVCPNYLTSGQFYARNNYFFAKSWNVTRTGSNSQASIKFNNNYVSSNNLSPLWIGMEPYKGVEVSPTTLGNKILKGYIALKNFTSESLPYFASRIEFIVKVPEVDSEGNVNYNYYSSNCNWLPDDSTWSNDTDLTLYRFETPLEVKDLTNNIDVQIRYSWYDNSGYVYIDPDFKLIDAA